MVSFPEIDIEGLKKELLVEGNAINQARTERPARSDTSLDGPQKEIVQAISLKLEEARKEAAGALEFHESQQQEIELGMDISRCETIPQKSKQDIHRAQAERRSNLIACRKNERVMLCERNAFAVSNRVHREPSYPDSKIFHWALVLVAVVAESVANSYFFSKGSDLGLLGGAFQALLISVANIGSALLVGVYVVPLFNHFMSARRASGVIGTVVYTIVLFFFNLATAHYRAQLELDPFNALIKAIPRLIQNPFGVGN